MRIGLFSDTFPPDINGVANSTNILYHALTRMGHEVYCVAPFKGHGHAKWDETHHILRLAGSELKFLYGYVLTSPIHFTAMQEIKELNLDVIHVQTEFGVGLFGHMCANQFNIPIVSTYHTTYEDYTHYANPLNLESFDTIAKKAVAKLSKIYSDSHVVVIAPSRKTKELLEGYKVKKHIEVIPTGLDLDRFGPEGFTAEKRSEVRRQYGFHDDDRIIVYVGRLAEEKSLDLVLDGFKVLRERGTKAKLMIVGGGPDLEKLQDAADAYGLHDDVLLTGPIKHDLIPDIYRAADMFASASLSETQGMTFIEALASGLPLLARKDEVLDGLLLDGETGHFFSDKNDFADAAEDVIAMLEEDEEGVAARCREVVSPFESSTFANSVLAVYERAVMEYKDLLLIDDVQVKESYVQLYILTSAKEEKRLMVTLDDYSEYGLRKGGMMSEEVLNVLQKKEEGVKAYQGCIRRIAMHDRTRKEVYDWLTQETGCDISVINRIVEKLEEHGYINDERFCTEQVASMRAGLIGSEKIIRILKKKGIPYEMIEEKLAADPDADDENGLIVAERLLAQEKGESLKKKKYTLRTKLMQKGYDTDTIDQVMEKLDFSRVENEELDNLRKLALRSRHRYQKKYSSTELRNHVYRYCMAQGFRSEDVYAILDEMEWDDD